MNDLQKIVCSYHEAFLGERVDRMVGAAKKGKFSLEIEGQSDQLKALIFLCAEYGVKIELEQAKAKLSWAY